LFNQCAWEVIECGADNIVSGFLLKEKRNRWGRSLVERKLEKERAKSQRGQWGMEWE